MKLKELKASSFCEDKKYDFILPIGSTEQHGPFLPFGTDTYVTDYLIDQVAKKFPKIIILPTLEYSRSQEHRGFFGTIWLTEETLGNVLFDVCSSLKDRARNIFIVSFHANETVVNKFIKNNSFSKVKIINLEIVNEEDDKKIQNDILMGPIDEHAGNSEIANMLIINKKLVSLPSSRYPKFQVDNPWETDNLIDKCPNGICDSHPKWIVNRKTGQKILDIYFERITKNLHHFLT